MSAFDWINFLERYGIEYITVGPNVQKDNVNVHCPWCGAGDPSHHMGISLVGPWYGCWRNPEHRGKSAARLVRALLGCTLAEAHSIVGSAASLPSDLLGSVEALMLAPTTSGSDPDKSLSMPKEFKPLKEGVASKYFWKYLRDRRYSDRQIGRMTSDFGIRYCKDGPFAGRIVFPVFYEGKLKTWTARTIFKGETLRYKTLTVDADRASVLGLEPAAGNINEFLLWYDDLQADDNETIFIVEGPFDALRVRTLGSRLGITATCFFTSAPSRIQMGLFHELLPKYKNRYLLLDEGTTDKTQKIKAAFGGLMTGIGVDVVQLPPKVKDPGDLKKEEFLSLVRGT